MRLTDDVLLARAIPSALKDRADLVRAYAGVDGDVVESIKAQSAQIRAIKGKRLRDLTEPEREAARLAFVYAEQYERGLDDAQPERRARENARRYREVRLRLWGKTEFEHRIDDTTHVVSIWKLKDLFENIEEAA